MRSSLADDFREEVPWCSRKGTRVLDMASGTEASSAR